MHRVLADRVKEHRKGRGWSQQRLAEEMAGLGYPIDRVTLSKLEAGNTRAENASMQEVLVLAAALDVPPALLFLPLGEGLDVRITPAVQIGAEMAFAWWCGEEQFVVRAPDGANVARRLDGYWARAAEPIRLLREHERLTNQTEAAWAAARRSESSESGGRFDLALSALFQHRRYMRMAGQEPPWLGDEYLDRADELGLDEGVTR
ncbi:hypothetical protein BH23ACT2_BH23ACT2_07340 [soil metagenome]